MRGSVICRLPRDRKAPARRSLLLQQVQLARPKGNRWLFKLPTDLLSYIVQQMSASFAGFDVCVIDGGALASRITAAYAESGRCLDAIPRARIERFYNQPIAAHERAMPLEVCGSQYYVIKPVAQALS
jgi:hypothetical protein